MRRGLTIALALTVICGLSVAPALAGPGCGGAKKAEGSKSTGCAKTCETGAFPTMVMMVADKSYQCPMAAQQAAEQAGSRIIYAVDTERFDDKNKAMEALAAASESYAEKFLTIGCVLDGKMVYCCDKTAGDKITAGGRTCGMKAKTDAEGSDKQGYARKASAEDKGSTCQGRGVKAGEQGKAACDKSKCNKFVVAGRNFDSWDDAVKARDAARAAAAKVKLAYLVDGQTITSDEGICPNAKAAGKVQFIVNEEKTDSEANARVLLAKSKCAAAQNALNEATAKL